MVENSDTSLCVIFQDLRRLFRGRLQNSAVEMKRTKSPFFTGVRKQALLLSGQYYMGNGKSNTAVREAAARICLVNVTYLQPKHSTLDLFATLPLISQSLH